MNTSRATDGISKARAIEMVEQLGPRATDKPPAGEYAKGWNAAISHAVHVLKGEPCLSGEPAAELERLDCAMAALLNSHSQENGSNTPDFILADYMLACLRAFERASKDREAWSGRSHPSGMYPE